MTTSVLTCSLDGKGQHIIHPWAFKIDPMYQGVSNQEDLKTYLGCLGGSFKYVFYFHPYLGKIPQFDEHIFSNGLKPPTSCGFDCVFFFNVQADPWGNDREFDYIICF